MHLPLKERDAIRSPVAKIMSNTIPIDPLSLYPSVRTSDADSFRHVLTTVYGAKGLSIPNPKGLNARGNLLALDDVSLGFSSCGARAMVAFGECNYARLQIPLSGHASTTSNGATTIIHGDKSCVTSPGQSAELDYGHGFEQLVLRVSADSLVRKLTSLLEIKPRGPIEFDPSQVVDSSADRVLQDLLKFMIRQIDDNPAGLPLLVSRELEQSLIVGFLTSRVSNFTELLAADRKDVAPWQVRRAEEYIEANWDQAITIEKLAHETGVGTRALFAAFSRSRGYSPMAFAKMVRLKHARIMLQQATLTTSVTAVALACGFANQGHFARGYRETFGERPSETLARAKR